VIEVFMHRQNIQKYVQSAKEKTIKEKKRIIYLMEKIREY